MATVSIVAAMTSETHLIGINESLPWGRNLPSDLSRFRRLTENRTVIMGRKTYESLPVTSTGERLPGRHKIVLSRSVNANLPSNQGRVTMLCDIGEALEASKHENEVFVIGGAAIYAQAFALNGNHTVTRMYLTYVRAPMLEEGTPGARRVHFPTWDSNQWKERQQTSWEYRHTKDCYETLYRILERTR